MFNLTTNKIVGIVGGVAGVSATSAGIVYLTSDSNQSKTINPSHENKSNKVSNKLTSFGYLPLKTDGTELASVWANMLVEYGKIKEKETTLEEIKDEQALKSKCSLALSSEDTEQTNYSFAKRFCVKEETITVMLKRNGYTKLNTEVTSDNKAKWETILNSIKENAQAKKAIGLVLTEGTNNHLTLLANACKNFDSESSKTNQDKEFEKHYEEAKQWCSSKGLS